MARIRVPEGAFEIALQVRSYEVGRDGCVRPANILRYFEYLATEASAHRGFDHTWYERNGSAWVVREMRLLLGALPGIGERLRMATWLSSYGRVQAYREYALWREGETRLVARAQGRWAYVNRDNGQLQRIPEDLISRFGALGVAMPEEYPEADFEPQAEPPSTLAFVARRYETDLQQHINNAVYMDWLEEGMATSVEALEPSIRGDLRLRHVHLEYLRPIRPGDSVRVEPQTRWASRKAVVVNYTIQATDDERPQTPILRAQMWYLRVGHPGDT
jgi:acyl-CoA thioesterase FadM